MTHEIWDKVADTIENSKFYKRYGAKTGWTSGSSTYVYPITNWCPNKEIEIQLLSDLRGIHNSVKPLIRELSKHIKITDHYIVKNDGSCPNVYRICYE